MSTAMKTVEKVKYVQGFAPATPGNVTHDYVSLKGYGHVTVVISVDNGATVTGAAIALKQATAVAGTGVKALSFSTMWANTDVGAGDTLTKTAVTSDTFTTDTTNAKNLMYVIEIDASELDVENSFDCFAVATSGTAANMVASVLYILSDSRYAGSTPPAAITD